jgi:MarR family transcriptional regulator, organic hydroperoxide resistance regulator
MSDPAADLQSLPDERPISFGHRVRTVARRIDRAMLARISRYGLTMPHYYVLRELFNEEGLTQRELSDRLNLTEAASVVTLQRMEQLGLILRARDPADRRKMNVYLSPKARKLRIPLHRHALEVNALARKGLSDADILRFRAILDHMDQNLVEA